MEKLKVKIKVSYVVLKGGDRGVLIKVYLPAVVGEECGYCREWDVHPAFWDVQFKRGEFDGVDGFVYSGMVEEDGERWICYVKKVNYKDSDWSEIEMSVDGIIDKLLVVLKEVKSRYEEKIAGKPEDRVLVFEL